jgi:hypothetical protein
MHLTSPLAILLSLDITLLPCHLTGSSRKFPKHIVHSVMVSLELHVLAFSIIAHGTTLYQKELDATDRGTRLSLRFHLLIGTVMNVAGLVLCMGWYVFKDIYLKGAEGIQQ